MSANSMTHASGSTALRFDVVAGLVAAAVVLPKAMAYASIPFAPAARRSASRAPSKS